MSKENLRRSCIDCAVTACENNGANIRLSAHRIR